MEKPGAGLRNRMLLAHSVETCSFKSLFSGTDIIGNNHCNEIRGPKSGGIDSNSRGAGREGAGCSACCSAPCCDASPLLLPHPKMVTEQPGSILTGSHSAFSPLASSVQQCVCEICAHCVLWLIRPLLLSVP